MLVNREHPLRPGRAGLLARLTILSVLAIVSLFPMYWMILTAFQPRALTLAFPPEFLPSDATLANFRELLARPHLIRWTLNSLLYAGSVTALRLLTASLAGYAFAKLRFPGSSAVFWLLLVGIMIPFQATLVPLFIIMTRLHLANTYLGLILPAVASPFSVFLMKQVMQTIPSELFDAARVDGASEPSLWYHVAIPLAGPGLAFLGIITFVEAWNAFLWPLVITSSLEMRTLQVGLVLLKEEIPLAYGLQMAGATYASFPIMIVFFAFHRFFLRGVTIGAIKG